MQNNIIFFLFFLLVFISTSVLAEDDLREKYSDILLTDHHGLLKERDLLIPIKSIGRKASKWQCFPLKDVKLNYETWRDRNELGEMDNRYDYYFSVKTKSGKHIYSDRRGQNYESFWKIIFKQWVKSKKDGEFVCINGVGPIEDSDAKGRFLWDWDIVITRSRCFSYFSDLCYMKDKTRRHVQEVNRE